MRRLVSFTAISLDGYYSDPSGDMNWAHKPDQEWSEFVAGNAKGDSQLVFGRVTYDLMVAFWPTRQALESLPAVAERMNSAPKVVFSRTLDKASWNNTKLVKGDIADAMRKMKKEPGPDMVILGSGSIVAQFAQERLIDEFQIVVSPIALGKGKSLFAGVNKRLNVRLTATRAFKNGNVVLNYEPAP